LVDDPTCFATFALRLPLSFYSFGTLEITFVWSGMKVELGETPRAVTPFGGLVVFFEFLRQVGYCEEEAPAVSSHFVRRDRSRGDLHGILAFGGGRGAARILLANYVVTR
jgi:hypothetical protein